MPVKKLIALHDPIHQTDNIHIYGDSGNDYASICGCEKTVQFAGMVLKAHRNDGYPGDLDGGTLQEYALKCGLIERREVSEPCGAWCSCLEFGGRGEFPLDCLFNTPAGKTAIESITPQPLERKT